VAISSASQPDFYMGLLEGSLRIMPSWEINGFGHTLTLSVLIPALLPLGLVLTGAALWPFFEQWATGDKAIHNINDRPRNAPVRTATGMATITFYGVMWAEGANDVIADKLQIPLYTITWIARVMIFVGPAIAFFVTKRICLGLQRKDNEMLLHGYESGIIRQMPNGEFIEVHRPVNEEARAVLEAKRPTALMPGPGSEDANGIPAPSAKGLLGKARVRANRAFAETVVLETNGHGNGHEEIEAGDAQPVGAGQLPAGDAAEEETGSPGA
jgi:ubiquinol-cytochrome c reductase cytochrome b subunit